ncbi:MAG: DUF1398 family protein, partial [Limisphaerales bacterium]
RLRRQTSRRFNPPDFPTLIRELKGIGVTSYDHMIETGANVFHGGNGGALTLANMGPACPVTGQRIHVEPIPNGEYKQ